jgi:putative ABC transport system permease protein
MTVYRQVNYMVNADYGFNQQNIVNIRLNGTDYEKLANQIRGLAGVSRVGGISHSLGTWADGASDYKRNQEDDLFVIRDFSVDENYLLNLEVPLIAGTNFEAGADRQVILNEKALESFGFERAADAVGQKIFMGDSTELIIAGVVKNFNFRPLSYEIGPVVFRYDPRSISILSAKIVGDAAPLLSSMEAIWKKNDPRIFDARVLSDEIDASYEEAGFFDIVTIVGYITVVAIVLACLGMLGMAMYATQTRIKEIGVRKVMGATVPDILLLLSKSFIFLIGIAVVIGAPVSVFLGNQFLSLYAYKVNITVGLISTGVLFLVVLGTGIICSQTIRAATTNPLKSLRYE